MGNINSSDNNTFNVKLNKFEQPDIMPDTNNREKIIRKYLEDDRREVINYAIKEYNSGKASGYTETGYNDDTCNYCDNIKAILGSKLKSCEYHNGEGEFGALRHSIHYKFN
jgi:hypothetical protein